MYVDWGSKIIYVFKTDLTLVSGSLYELDTNQFRLNLKALEDDVAGMPYIRTHRHNTQVSVAGVTYARTIEIINGYSVLFEDGQYTVRLVGSNNNIFDVESGILIQNSVSVIPTNSAGLQVVTQGSGVTPQDKQDIINGVWDEQVSSHNTSGSFGHFVQKKLLTVIKFLGLK